MEAEDLDDDIKFAWSLDRDSEQNEDYSSWLELLKQASSRRGLVRVTVARFARRGGYKIFADVGVGPANKTPSATTNVEFDARRLAKEAHAHAARDHRRTAAGYYRLQLWHASAKKNGSDRPGDIAAIKFDAAGGSDSQDTPSSFEGGILKTARDMLNDARKHNETLAQTHVALVQAASGTALHGIQLVEEMSKKQMQLSNAASQLQRAPTAADVNARINTVASKLQEPLRIIATAVAAKIHSEQRAPGAAPHPPPQDPSADQKAAQAFFHDLSGEQKDQLRDILSEPVFHALVEVVMGPPEQWAVEAEDFSKIMRQHASQIQKILTPEQLMKVMNLL